MAIWKDNTAVRQPQPATHGSSSGPEPARETPRSEPPAPRVETSPPQPSLTSTQSPGSPPVLHREIRPTRKESLIADDITIEGKIEGAGSVRIAGKFKGDVSVQGDLTIEIGAKLTGGVRADKVMIAGELEGNVEQASRVDLLATGMVTGDLKSGSLTVAAGARMRGQTNFGWEEGQAAKVARHPGERPVESAAD